MKVVLSDWPGDTSAADRVLAGMRAAGSTDVTLHQATVDVTGRYSVIVSRDPVGPPVHPQTGAMMGDFRWHVSAAGEKDVPKWAHLVAIAHQVKPGICFVVGVPPRSWWMNVHPHTLHLWELRDGNLISQWLSEARGHTPS